MIYKKAFILPFSIINALGSVTNIVLGPSLVFYVLENGGTKEDYGVVLGAYSLASFAAKPFIGLYSDRIGFRIVYFVTLAIAALGGLVYFAAGAFDGMVAIGLICMGRLLNGLGLGAAVQALDFAYVARMVKNEEQTKINTFLSMVSMFGFLVGPVINIILADLDSEWFGVKIDNLSTVGLVLFVCNLLALIAIYFLLEEPTDIELNEPPIQSTTESPERNKDSVLTCVRHSLRFSILLPLFTVFTYNTGFEIIQTCFAPSSAHALDWTPTTISLVMSMSSSVIFFFMTAVFGLSATLKVKDEYLVMVGAFMSMIGYFFVWDFWKWESSGFYFIFPVLVATSGYPFLAAPIRSVYTKAVDEVEILRRNQGMMQAVLSMSASVAGFVTPALIAAFLLRTPAQVENSQDLRELSPVSIAVPAMMGLILVGITFDWLRHRTAQLEKGSPDETTSLIQSQRRQRRFLPKDEVNRKTSVMVMGMVQGSMLEEREDKEIILRKVLEVS